MSVVLSTAGTGLVAAPDPIRARAVVCPATAWSQHGSAGNLPGRRPAGDGTKQDSVPQIHYEQLPQPVLRVICRLPSLTSMRNKPISLGTQHGGLASVPPKQFM